MKSDEMKRLQEYLQRLERSEPLSSVEAVDFSDLIALAREQKLFADDLLRNLTELSVQALLDVERRDRAYKHRTPPARGSSAKQMQP